MNADDLIVQESAYEGLTAWGEKLPHALLLHGPKGIGKLQLAEHFARFLLCEGRGAALQPCGRCEGCRWVRAGSHPDLRLVEPEAMARQTPAEDAEPDAEGAGRSKKKPSIEIRIEQVRQLDDFIHMGSHRAGRRVAIVHPAEDMNAPTANALLKNLEEPPPGAVFILVSHRPARLLPTVRSRCVQLPLAAPNADAAARWLDSRGVKDAARWLAFAGGAPMRAAELATDARGERIGRWRESLDQGAPGGIEAGSDREELELLVDVLQKYAFDRALESFGLMSKYRSTAAKGQPVSPQAWLAYARALGRERLLARHPLNPKLFAETLLRDFPGTLHS